MSLKNVFFTVIKLFNQGLKFIFIPFSVSSTLAGLIIMWAGAASAGPDHDHTRHEISKPKSSTTIQSAPAAQVWGENYFPNYELTAHTGEKLRFFDDVIKGKVVSINFIFTSCTDICSMETARVRAVFNLLKERAGEDVFFYSITIDPEHDTVEVLNEYAERFSINGEKWKFLTGNKKEIDDIRAKFGLYGDLVEEKDLSNHNINMIIGNQATGHWVKRSPYENSHILANQLGSWMHNWKKVPSKARRKYDQAPKLRQISNGEMLFRDKCTSCHVIDGGYAVARNAQPIGPDLFQVTRNRSKNWLERWLADPKKMLEDSDPIATTLLDRYKIVMPNFRLNKKEIGDLINYMAQESDRLLSNAHSKKGA